MKRIISWVLTVIMMVGMFGSFSVQFAFASATDVYDALVTAGSSAYGDTMIVNSVWTDSDLTAGKQLSYVFRGKTYTETYDAKRHFNTFGSAQDAWFARFTVNGTLTSEVAKYTPNYILLGEILRTDPNGNPMGTNEQKNTCLSDIWIRFSANLYGATAGIDPNDPDYDPATALPGSEWEMNEEWVNPTIVKTTIFQSTRVDRNQNTTDKRYENLLTEAGVNHLTLTIDGLQFDATSYNDVPVWQYGVSGCQREVDLVFRNSYINDTEFFVACNEDASRNYWDFDIDNVRIENITNPVFFTANRTTDVNRMNVIGVENVNGVLWDTPSTSRLKYATTTEGNERGMLWKFTNSRFADNMSAYMGRWSDNIYLPFLDFEFTGCMFDNATVSSESEFAFKTFSGNSRYPRLSMTLKNNTFNTDVSKTNTVVFGLASWQAAAYDLAVNNNRIIGYKSVLPHCYSGMETMLAGCKWDIEDNYYADSFTSVDDTLGKKPEYYAATATVLPVNVDNVNYYYDYKMTACPADLWLEGASFEEDTVKFAIDHTAGTVTAGIREGVDIADLSFTAQNENTVVTVYSDGELTTPVTSLSAEALADGSETLYVQTAIAGKTKMYTFTITSMPVNSLTEWKDPTGQIDSSDVAVLLPTGTYADGEKVTVAWQGGYYEVVNGTTGFTTVAAARAAGFTDVIMPIGTYGAIDINGSVNLYGNHYATDPNVHGEKPTDDWALASAWAGDRTVVTGNITVLESATPTTDAGLSVAVRGIELKAHIDDSKRLVSNYRTDVVVENVLLTYNSSGNGRFIFNYDNANTSNTDEAYTNIDSFTMRGMRYACEAYLESYRIFPEDVPSRVVIEDCYFGESFGILGWPKYRQGVKNGSVEYVGNYFKNYSGYNNFFISFTGAAQFFDAATYNNSVKFNNNVVINCSAQSQSVAAIEVYPGSYKSVEIRDNHFINTDNNFSYVLKLTGAQYAPVGQDWSDIVKFTGNRIVGQAPYIRATDGTTKLSVADGNYYSYYRDGFDTAVTGSSLYGVLDGSDYYLDYAMTVLASDADMVVNHDSAVVDAKNRRASVIIGKDETFVPDITASDRSIVYNLYADKDCTASVSEITADNAGRTFYAKAVKNGVTVVYELYVSAGNADAPEYEDAYLLDDATADMPIGTVYTKVFKGTEYKFTAGVNAFASISQITYANGTDSVANVLLPEGTYAGGDVVTGNVNIIGDNAVIKEEFDTKTPVKIAAVGDSITEANAFGETNRQIWGYPAQLQNILDETYGEGNYEVQNFGKGNSTLNPVNNSTDTSLVGATRSQYTQGSWYYEALDYNPDVVIVMIGHNDTDTAIFTTKEQYKAYYQELIDSFRQLPSNPQIIISGCHTRGESFRRDLLVEAIIPAQQELAAENNIIYIDNLTPTVGIENNSDLSSDGLHFTAKGYNFLARLIKAGMESILTSDRSVTTDGVTVKGDAEVYLAPERIKIACIGDQITYGAACLKNYPDYLQDMLGDRYDVRNYGECKTLAIDNSTVKSGGTDYAWKTFGNYPHIGDYHSSLTWKPDIAIFMLGLNDAGTNLTSNHTVSWADGAADEFVKDYTALIKEYEALGTKIVLANTITLNTAASRAGTDVAGATVNPLIAQIAANNGWSFIDTHALTNGFGKEMYNGSYLTMAGNEALAQIMHDSLFVDFATEYVDELGQIQSDAVVVDYSAPAYATGSAVTYEWDGANYSFVWGVNAFASVNAAIASDLAQDDGRLQILIPANSVGTTGKFTIGNTAAAGNMTSIEVFGVNRNIDPNDKSKAYVDPTADWTLNSAWGTKGDSGIGVIEILTTGETTLKGNLIFNGVTLRANYLDTSRTAGTADDPRNLNVVFSNTVLETTAELSASVINDHCSARRGTTTHGDAISFVNFRIEKYQGTSSSRFFAAGGSMNSAYTTFDNFYVSSATATLNQMGWIHGAPGYASSAVIVVNSQFRGIGTLELAPSQDGQENEVATVTVKNNVFYATPGHAILLCPGFISTPAVEGNYFVMTDAGAIPIKSQAADESYSLKNNVFVLADVNAAFASGAARLSASAPDVDMTGCYVATYDSNYQSGTAGIDPSTLTGFMADYYFTDFAKTARRNNLFPDFALTYVDEAGEINSDAYVLDIGLDSSYADGETIAVNWEGKSYSFILGENIFRTTDAIFAHAAARKVSEVQILIPANNVATDQTTYDFIIADNANSHAMTKVEVFGVNRLFDPNVKNADDPTADWTLSSDWGKYGESAVTRIQLATKTAANIISGEITFKGITMRNALWDSRPATGGDTLDLTFENVVVNYTKTSTLGGKLFNFSADRYKSTTLACDDSLTLKNFRVEQLTPKAGQLRVFETGSQNNITFDGFYISSAKSPSITMGYLQSGNSVGGVFTSVHESAAIIVKNSNFRGLPLSIHTDLLGQNARAEGRPLNVEYYNNVFYNNTSASISLFGEWMTTCKIEGNYFVATNGVAPIIFNAGTNNAWTSKTVDYTEAIGYSLKDNTFILKDIANLASACPNDSTVVDLTGSYIETAAQGVVTAAPTGLSASYLWLDQAKTVKNTDLTVTSVSFADMVTDLAIDNTAKTVTGKVSEAAVIRNPALVCASAAVDTVFADADGNPVDIISISGDWSGTAALTVNGVAFDSYTVTLTATPVIEFAKHDDTDDAVKNSAVALYPPVSTLSVGDTVTIGWNGASYSFTVGVNVFATLDAVPADAAQVILPAATYGELRIKRSVEIYGEGYDHVPYLIEDDNAVENPAWVANGDTIVAGSLVIDAAATPANANGTKILVSGLRLTRQILDNERAISPYKTDIELKNNVLDRCSLSSSELGSLREINLLNANNTNNTTDNKNIDSFTITNMFYINRQINTDHALMQEDVPANFTIDGFACNNNMSSIGFPKWKKSVTEGTMTLKNSFFKNHNDDSARFAVMIYFSGHSNSSYTTAERAKLDLNVVVENNTFINCGPEFVGYDSANYAPVTIFPASFSDIKVIGNDFVSTYDYNYKPILWSDGPGYSDNVGDMTDKITLSANRYVGVIAPWIVNADTTLDMSGSYFETYTVDYKNGVSGDIPADTDADYYLDYGMTTLLSDMTPKSSGVAGMTVNNEARYIYGYAAADVTDFAFAGGEGISYTVYSDMACENAITSLDIEVGKAAHAYVKAAKGDIELVYQLYVMGVKDVADITSEDINATVADLEQPTLYYPTLHGAPGGIEVVSYYDGGVVKFTKGEDVVVNAGEFGMYGDDIIIPDDITELSIDILSDVNIHTVNADVSGSSLRKVKIAAVGDSITAGGWPEHMQNYLGTVSYEVKNFGQSGATVTTVNPLWWNSAGTTERKYTIYAKSKYDNSLAYRPDFIIIGLGTNDSYGNRWTSNDRFVEQYVELIRSYQALDSKPAVYLTPMTEAYDNAGRTIRRDENILYLQYLVAEMTGAKILDARTLLDYVFEPTAGEYCTDLLHPTATGYRVMGETLGAEIQKTYTGVKNHTVSAVEAKAPDCTQSGYIAHYTCTDCGEFYETQNCVIRIPDIDAWRAEGGDGYVAPLGHDFKDVEGKAATCTEDGYTAHKVCETCEHIEGYAVIPASHVLKDVAGKEATCTEDGHTAYKACENCDYTEGYAVIPASHIFEDVAEKPATCTEDGYTAHKVCSRCEHIEGKQTLTMLGHNMQDVAGVAPTCKTEGVTAHKACSRCDLTEGKASIAVVAHKYTNYIADKAATCTENATEMAICDFGCGTATLRVVENSKLGHDLKDVAEVPATETEDGVTAHKACSRCDHTEGKEVIPATGKPVEIVDTTKVFADVKANKWYTNAINYAYSHGFIAGLTETEFGINDPITRGQFITILARMAGVDTGNAANRAATTKFTDVKSGKFYTAAIAWASENGVVSGVSDTEYAPNAPIERQQLCVMIVNYAKFMGVEITASEDAISFADGSTVGKYAKKAVAICQQADIVNGYNEEGGVTFRPKATATRAEAAQILYKFHKDFAAK